MRVLIVKKKLQIMRVSATLMRPQNDVTHVEVMKKLVIQLVEVTCVV